MLASHTYFAEEPGPRVLILGAVHGNEICGPLAMQRIMAELDSGQLRLVRGQAAFVPVANPRAYAEGKRYIDRNLNRYFLPVAEPKLYEDKLVNILSPMIAACDVLLDFHSTTAGGMPFASLDGAKPEEHQLAAAMGAEIVLFGWQQAYAASGRANPDPDESVGTTAYARRHGAEAVLLECGQHQDTRSAEVAYRAIRNALSHLGLVSVDQAPRQTRPVAIRTTRVVYRPEQGGVFTENWGNFSPIKAGQKVAILPGGAAVEAPADGYIILPNPTTPAGSEWFYFGEKA